MSFTGIDSENHAGLDLKKAGQAAENYSKACKIACRVIDRFGLTQYLAAPYPEQISICGLAGKVLPGARSEEADGKSQICANSHLYGCYQSERYGGRNIYFCPLGLTHWASPILKSGNVVGALLGGPVHLADPEDILVEDLISRNGIHPDYLPELKKKMKDVPVIGTERAHALSELLYLVACGISDDSTGNAAKHVEHGRQEADLWEQIRFMKSFVYSDESQLTYPIAKETALLERIETGDKPGAQQILNEILGHIFFSSSGSITVMRARVVELVVLLSRAAIRGGADVQQIFGLNYAYLDKIGSFQNIDELAYWLSGIMTRFSDQIFNLTNVKHADVIYRAVNYIKKNYRCKITLEETAAYVYLSPAYFSSVFKEETGENFNVYVNMVRVEGAKKLLLNEEIALSDVAPLVGFEGQSYFSKVFKKMTGVTPGKYRESRGKITPGKENNPLEVIDDGNFQ